VIVVYNIVPYDVIDIKHEPRTRITGFNPPQFPIEDD